MALSAVERTVPAAILIMGNMNIQGDINGVHSVTEPIQISMDNGARRVLVPTENKRSFPEVNADILKWIDSVFYGDIRTTLFKAMGIS